MLVSHRSKFIYTKTVKTAGTSVELYFEPFCVDGAATDANAATHRHHEAVSAAGIVGFRGPNRPSTSIWWNHMPAANVKQRLGDSIWNSYFKFCVVRNPFDKVISLFYFQRKTGRIQVDPSAPDREQFARWLSSRRLPVDRNKFVIDGEFCLDDVIKYERLNQDMERICQRVGVPWIPSAFAKVKSGIRPAAATIANMYTRESAEAVRSRFAFEFHYFGYPETPELAARPTAAFA
jgi:Sulfotransferase family